MSKMGLHHPFGLWNTSYGQKKGQQSNWQFDSWPLKVGNRLDFLVCRWCVTYCLKDFNKGYNFAWNLVTIGGLNTKLWGSKVVGVLILGISRFPLGSLGRKSHLDVGLVERHIRGKVVASPKSGPWWVLWVWVCPWLVLAPKVLQLCANQLVVWFV
jgi:hypothetical protein